MVERVVAICRQRKIDLKSEKELRRRLREEKRKTKVLEKLKIKGADEINEKIAKEEKKLLKAQRKLEAIRLVEELFKRIRVNLKLRLSLFSCSIIFFLHRKKWNPVCLQVHERNM